MKITKNKFLTLLSLFIFNFTLYANETVKLVLWSEPESVERITRSDYKKDFFRLSNNYEAQSNITFCGPTSAAIVLNTLRLNPSSKGANKDQIPLSEGLTLQDRKYFPKSSNPFLHRYTQHNIFSTKTDPIKTLQEVLGRPRYSTSLQKKVPDFGLQLNQLAEILKTHGTDAKAVQVTSITDKDVDRIRSEFKSNLNNGDDFIIVNFYRKALGQNGGGHFSPIAAYDEKSDSFLVLDTNPLVSPWFWVTTSDLVKAMANTQTSTGEVEHRGYIIVSDHHQTN